MITLQKTSSGYETFAVRYISSEFSTWTQLCKAHGFRFDGERKRWIAPQVDVGKYVSDLISSNVPVHNALLQEFHSQCKEPVTFTEAFDRLERGFPVKAVCIYSSGNKYKIKGPGELKHLFDENAGNLSRVIERNSESGTYDTFDAELIIEVMTKLKSGYPDYPIFTRGVKQSIALRRSEIEMERQPIPEVQAKLMPGFNLFPYQNEAVRFLLKRDGRAILGYEMGLGKTLIILSYLAMTGKRALVICPKTIRRNWILEADKFFGIKGMEITSKFKDYSALVDCQIVSSNFESFHKHPMEMLGFDVLVVDESHRCKNPDAKTTIEVSQLAQKIPRVILLSGTAIKNRRDELYSQVEMVTPGLWKNSEALKKLSIGKIWNDISPFYRNKTKAEVLKDLPDKIQGVWDTPVEDFYYDIDSFCSLGDLKRFQGQVALLKVPATIEFIQSILSQSSSNVLVFSEFIEPVRLIAEHFGDLAMLHHGQMKDEYREQAKLSFQNRTTKARVLASTRPSLAVGATLTAADTVIFVDLPWSPADIRQAADRTHRIGQKNTVHEYWMKASSIPLENSIIDTLKRKNDLCKMVLEGKTVTPEERAWMDQSISLADLGIHLKSKPKKIGESTPDGVTHSKEVSV